MTLDAADLQHVLAHTAQVWPALRGQRVFLTGGTGFFGRWLIETYLEAQRAFDLRGQLVVLSRDPEAFARLAPELAAQPALQLVRGAQSDFVWPEGRFDAVIHAAVEYGTPSAMLVSNQLGLRRVLDFAAASCAKRVLLTSSGAVYGLPPTDVLELDEDCAYAPNPTLLQSTYGELKRFAELSGVVQGEAAGFECKIARCFAFVGPYLPLDRGAIGNFMADVLHDRVVHVNGDGTDIRSYLHAADLAIWLWTILIAGAHARPYNVGAGQPLSIADVAKCVSEQGTPPRGVVLAKQPQGTSYAAKRYVPSVRRAKQELGLSTLIGFDDAVRRTMAWHRRQPR